EPARGARRASRPDGTDIAFAHDWCGRACGRRVVIPLTRVGWAGERSAPPKRSARTVREASARRAAGNHRRHDQEAHMGLVDILHGMQNGPRGKSLPGNNPSGGSRMSPLTMALIGLLAYKAVKHFGGSQASAGAGQPAPQPPGGTVPAGT